MTPDERQMISGLFDRMRQQGSVDKDRDADAMIRDYIRQMPDAAYMLVQSVLVQEMALQNTQQQVQDLEDRVRELETAGRPQQSSGGSFLGNLFGGGARPAPASVPMTGRSSGSFGGGSAPAGGGTPWGRAPVGGQPAYGQQGGAMPMQQQAPAGGGFMRSAMTTAAGVAGGMLAANAISSMMKGDQAHASPLSSPQHAASDTGNDPGGSYNAADDGNDPAGSYDAADDGDDPGGSYDDGGSWSDE